MASVALSTKAVGSVVQLKENGTAVNYLVVHQGRPSSIYDSSCDGTWLLRQDVFETRAWHSSNVNDYANSTIHSYLNSTFLARFDSDIQAQIKQVKIPYRAGSGTSATITSGASGLSAKIFFLSDTEVGFTQSNVNSYITPNEGAKLDYFIEEGNTGGDGCAKRIAYLNGSASIWWLRSPYLHSSTLAWYVYSDGGADRDYCTITFGVRPALVLPSSLLVSDDGSVSTNTAPSTPATITIPDTIQGGGTIEISWSASTDAENNLEGYIVERSTDGGSAWTQIYQGEALKTTNTVPAGTDTVMYRVKAYDTDGLYSGYKTSSQVSVINNNLPTAPASLTVPNTVYGGQTVSITWGAATDPDGDELTYTLERQADGGDWTQIYSGAALSYSDTITRGLATVAYRVKAVDTHAASGPYITSETRTVNNNLAPTITCSQVSGTDLGLKNAAFSLDYAATDPDGDTVTVTEAVDGVAQKTFTAEPDQTYTFIISALDFQKLLNGDHTLTITASDGKVETVHTLYFEKLITQATITLANAVPADARIEVCVLSVSGSIPADADFSVTVTNNGLDDEPVWEDCTADVKSGTNHVFTNETQTNGWAFNFFVSVSRGESGEGGYINSVQGGFQ